MGSEATPGNAKHVGWHCHHGSCYFKIKNLNLKKSASHCLAGFGSYTHMLICRRNSTKHNKQKI